MSNALPEKQSYKVLVDENSHYMEESERYAHGEYDNCETAISECRCIIDSFLLFAHRPSMTEQQLWELYTLFGEDPFIVSADPDCSFSAWDYARQRCRELCGNKKSY